MKNVHTIQSRIMRLAILQMLLISVTLLAYATIGGIANTTSTLEDSIKETAGISALAIKNQLEIYETAISEAAATVLISSSTARERLSPTATTPLQAASQTAFPRRRPTPRFWGRRS